MSGLATGATDDSFPDGDVGSAILPDCAPEDKTVSWISRLPDSNRDPLDALSADRPVQIVSCGAPLDLEETVDPLAQTISCDLPVDTDDWTIPPDLTDELDR